MTIQFILSFGLVATTAFVFVQRTAPRIMKWAVSLVSMIGAYFVWLPEHATVVANLLGVGRGADLVMYIWILISLVLLVNLHLKLRRLHEDFTEMARAVALMGPSVPEKGPSATGSPGRSGPR